MIRFIDKYRDCFSVEFICKTLKNNRAGYQVFTTCGPGPFNANIMSNRIARPPVHRERNLLSGTYSPGAGEVDVQQQWVFNKE
ncbi:hypothetical protein D9543_05385 [Corynebacterium macginleyi]|uniref:Uncharacterized protein n=1 Tax=Corynebacterium macginleyi TaxID=38290 RepID=A0A3M0G6X4_9CORY|nr:hypothetical protein D9543_05385 [Corynebacterium macginleyi]